MKTYQRLEREVYWVGMKASVHAFVADCAVCQQAKYLTLVPARLLQALPIPDKVWEDISMDFIEGLPKSEGYDAIMVVVHQLCKYAHSIPLKHLFIGKSVAAGFVKEVVRFHGYPRSIVSD